jgi:hypothetical protein
MTDEVELITIVLPTSKQSVQLSREASAYIWEAAKRANATSVEEYLNQALERWLADQTGVASSPESMRAKENDRE